MATTPAPEAKSSSSPIPSTVVQKFYDESGALHEAGRDFAYVPKEDQPYPWPILRPKDEQLAKELEAEYRAHHKKKMQEINARTSLRTAFENITNLRDD